MSGLETLGGILNITQILGVILSHVIDHISIRGVIEAAKGRADRIYNNVQLLKQLAPLETLDEAMANFINDTVQDFAKLEAELTIIQQKVTNRNVARTFLTSPQTISELKEIENRLRHKEHNIQVMGMVGALLVENRGTREQNHYIREETRRMREETCRMREETRCMREKMDHLCQFLAERRTSTDMQPAENVLRHACQLKYIETNSDLNSSHRNEWDWLHFMDADDKLAMGISFYEGNRRFKKNYVKAARYFHSALSAGKSESNYFLGSMYQSGQGVERCNITAFKFFSEGTRAEDPGSTGKLGYCYLQGAGVEYNLHLGFAYIKMGVERGDPGALSFRSWHKLYGYHTERNEKLAFQLSTEAVDKGNEMAKMNLATCYMNGVGVERNAPKAVQLWTEAVEAGGYSCLTDLGRCYEFGLGVGVNLRKAVEIYKMGAELESPSWRRRYVQPFYGLCLIRGRGVCQDVKKGWDQIHSSVQADNDCGWYVQGHCYHYGYGVEQSIRTAIDCYLRATRSKDGMDGQIRARFALGCMYESGEGVPQNLKKAFQYFDFGANRMYQDAQWKVAAWCESGIGVEKNLVRAAAYFGMAADGGHREAQIKSCEYYMKGKGVQRNLMKIAQILRPAAESGNTEASELLKRVDRRWRTRLKLSRSS